MIHDDGPAGSAGVNGRVPVGGRLRGLGVHGRRNAGGVGGSR